MNNPWGPNGWITRENKKGMPFGYKLFWWIVLAFIVFFGYSVGSGR